MNDTQTVRTAPPVYQGGRIYTPDPAAVERLRALMAEQRRQLGDLRQCAEALGVGLP